MAVMFADLVVGDAQRVVCGNSAITKDGISITMLTISVWLLWHNDQLSYDQIQQIVMSRRMTFVCVYFLVPAVHVGELAASGTDQQTREFGLSQVQMHAWAGGRLAGCQVSLV